MNNFAKTIGMVLLMFVLASIPTGAASLMGPNDDPPLPQDDRAASAPRSSFSTNHSGNSPVAPFAKDDSHFVTDVGTWLDRYLFRKDVPNGRLTFAIAIDRYYSPFITSDTVDGQGFLKSDTYRKLLDSHLLPDKATLTLQVWDVDHNAPPPNCAEVDHVFVNGRQVQNSRNTGPATLSSGNQTWSTWSTPIPTNMLKFPTQNGSNGSRPPAAANEIAVEIDVACGSQWAVEVDWGAIYIPSPIRPVVFAHGWTGDEHAFDAFADFMKTDGILTARQENLDKGIKTIPKTSPLLAKIIDKATAEFGVDKVNVFAHSKGGLFARYAQRDDLVAAKIDNLITFGSPHHGFDLPAIWLTCRFRFSSQNERTDCEESAKEFSIKRIREGFNYRGCFEEWRPFRQWKGCRPQYVQQPTISYRTLVGGKGDIGGGGDIGAKNATFPWRADQAPFPSRSNVDAEFDFRFGATPAEHSAIKERRESYQCAISFIDEEIYPSSNCTQQRERDTSSGAASGQAPILPGSEYQILLEKQDSLASNSTQTIEAYVDNGDRVLFNIFSIEVLSVTLITPSGQEITPDSVVSDTIHYATQQGTGFGDNLWWYQYQVDNPVQGNWGIRIQSTVDTDYQVVYMIDSALEFSSRTNSYTYQPGDIVTLEAVFLNSSVPLSGTLIQGTVVQPGGAEETLVFHDDSTNGDVESGDGIYTTQFTAGGTAIQRTGSPIHGHAVIDLVGSKDGTSRLLSTSIAVSSPTAGFLQVVNENPIDNDGDGFYDALQIDLLVNVIMSGQYEVSAELKDANGNLVVTAFYSTLANGTGKLPEGQNVIPLRFDGKQIRQHSMDGPYALTNLAIDFDGMFQVDTAHNVYTTSAYSVDQFQGAALSTR